MMKSAHRTFAIAALFSLVALFSLAANEPEKTFRGEIGDSQCSLNVHSASRSHKEMMDMSSDLKTPADCARFCVKERGGRYVLQTKDKVYKLDNQDLADKYAGAAVKVVGVLDAKTDTIAVRAIEPLPASKNN
ncbi:MAG TPA: DUF5818 domain-containing protein [Terriglobales bacterium]|nr:DUF5818 domain-containing protein [Terriglobales bacterium]